MEALAPRGFFLLRRSSSFEGFFRSPGLIKSSRANRAGVGTQGHRWSAPKVFLVIVPGSWASGASQDGPAGCAFNPMVVLRPRSHSVAGDGRLPNTATCGGTPGGESATGRAALPNCRSSGGLSAGESPASGTAWLRYRPPGRQKTRCHGGTGPSGTSGAIGPKARSRTASENPCGGGTPA
jgi:hypothetical protein